MLPSDLVLATSWSLHNCFSFSQHVSLLPALRWSVVEEDFNNRSPPLILLSLQMIAYNSANNATLTLAYLVNVIVPASRIYFDNLLSEYFENQKDSIILT